MRSQLKGARMLRKKKNPFFIEKVISELTNIHLGLEKKDFPKLLVGSHGGHVEILLRQLLLKSYANFSTEIFRSLGSGKSPSLPIPQVWADSLESSGIKLNRFGSKLALAKLSVICSLKGIAKTLILLLQYKLKDHPGKPYVVFLGLNSNNLPVTGKKKSYDIISWYKQSQIKKTEVKKIWAQINYIGNSNLHHVMYSRIIFPRITKISNYFKFLIKSVKSIFSLICGLASGKWWYGFLFEESVLFNYVSVFSQQDLARDYFFNNSNWFIKPLWTYEVERKGLEVSLYYYSTNIESIIFFGHERADTYGLKIMKWNNIIVWDKQQMEYLKKYSPNAHYKIAGIIDFSDSAKLFQIPSQGYNIAIFDVTPARPTKFTSLGVAIAPYYSEKLAIQFFMDIKTSLNDSNINLLWKQKRIVGRRFISKGFINKRGCIINKSFVTVVPEISARRLIDKCDAVISMPFTSTAILGKKLGKPSIFYDASSSINTNESHDIPVLKSKDELKSWRISLDVEKTLSINVK